MPLNEVPAPVQDILYLTAAVNSCINPFIYGVYYYKENTAPCIRYSGQHNVLILYRNILQDQDQSE